MASSLTASSTASPSSSASPAQDSYFDDERTFLAIYGNLFIGVSAIFGASIIVLLLWAVRLRVRPLSILPIFIVYLGLADAISDATFAAVMPTSSRELQIAQKCAIAIIFVAAVTNIVALLVLFRSILVSGVEKNDPFVRWYNNHRITFWSFLTLSFTGARMMTVVHSRMFDMDRFTAPLTVRAIDKLDLLGIVTVLIEDVPQAVLTILVTQWTDTWDSVSYSTLVFNMLTIALGVGCRAYVLQMNLRDADRRAADHVPAEFHKSHAAYTKGTTKSWRYFSDSLGWGGLVANGGASAPSRPGGDGAGDDDAGGDVRTGPARQTAVHPATVGVMADYARDGGTSDVESMEKRLPALAAALRAISKAEVGRPGASTTASGGGAAGSGGAQGGGGASPPLDGAGGAVASGSDGDARAMMPLHEIYAAVSAPVSFHDIYAATAAGTATASRAARVAAAAAAAGAGGGAAIVSPNPLAAAASAAAGSASGGSSTTQVGLPPRPPAANVGVASALFAGSTRMRPARKPWSAIDVNFDITGGASPAVGATVGADDKAAGASPSALSLSSTSGAVSRGGESLQGTPTATSGYASAAAPPPPPPLQLRRTLSVQSAIVAAVAPATPELQSQLQSQSGAPYDAPAPASPLPPAGGLYRSVSSSPAPLRRAVNAEGGTDAPTLQPQLVPPSTPTASSSGASTRRLQPSIAATSGPVRSPAPSASALRAVGGGENKLARGAPVAATALAMLQSRPAQASRQPAGAVEGAAQPSVEARGERCSD